MWIISRIFQNNSAQPASSFCAQSPSGAQFWAASPWPWCGKLLVMGFAGQAGSQRRSFIPIFQHVSTQTSNCVLYGHAHQYFSGNTFYMFCRNEHASSDYVSAKHFLSNKRQKHNNCIPTHSGLFWRQLLTSCRTVGIQKKKRTLPPLKNMNLNCPDTLRRKGKNILSCHHSGSFGHPDFNFGDCAGKVCGRNQDYHKNKIAISRENQI